MQGYVGKFFVTCITCSCLPTRKIGMHCVDVGSALKNNMVQAGLVFDVVLYLPKHLKIEMFNQYRNFAEI